MAVADDDLLVEVDFGPATPAGAPSSTGGTEPEVRGLDPRFVAQQRVVGWIVSACMSLVALTAAVAMWFAPGVPWPVRLLLLLGSVAFSAGIAWLFYAWPAVHFRHVSYRVSDDGIEIRTGVWWRDVMNVPRSRVQHIDVSQGPLERAYGLGRLVLYTAGTDHSRVELAGLEHGVALALRNHLLPGGADDAV
jgi:membrane protein YdbS with pleckstrin-like domain